MSDKIKRMISIMLTFALVLCASAISPVAVNAAAGEKSYSLDLEGMMNWMQDTKNLTDQQRYDIQRATTIINDAKEESFSQWYGGANVHLSDDRNDKITDLSDIKDAVNLRQMPIAIENMKRINVLRHEDDNYANLGMNDSYTNFYFMAVAATGAMRGAGLKRHSSLKVSCECLSWGTTNGADNWYYSEKNRFNNIKNTLGITTITSRDQIKQIEDYADDNNITIGHYTALFWSENQVMGVGYTPYSRTACYNASKSSNYSGFKLYTVEEFEALVKEFCAYVGTHDYDEGTTVVEPTCTQAGYASSTCRICGAEGQKELPATGHFWNSDFTVDKEATCTAAGSKSIHCANCDEVKDVTAVPANGHSFGEWTEVTPSTCEDSGVRQRVCSGCGLTETENIDPSGHEFEEEYTVDVAATCTADGSQSRHCANCDAVIDSQIIPSTGHNYGNWKTAKAATCTETGTRAKTCSACGDVISEEIPAKGHAWNSEPTVDKAATCTKEGSQSIHCSRCSETKDQEIIPAAGHKWNKSYTIDKPATKSAAGSKVIHCSVCNAVKEGSAVSIAKLQPSEIVDLPAVKIAKPKAAKKSVTVKWKKVSKKNQKKIAGIQIQYSTNRSFKTGVKTVTAKKTAASKKIKKLASKKQYYFRIRAYRNVNGVRHVSKWSAVKIVKAK